jgi:hypothetical protein
MRRFLPILFFALFISRADAQTMDTIAVVDTVWHPAITADTLRLPLNFDEQLLLDINALGHDTLPTLDFTMSAFTHSIYATTIVVPVGLYALGWAGVGHGRPSYGRNWDEFDAEPDHRGTHDDDRKSHHTAQQTICDAEGSSHPYRT